MNGDENPIETQKDRLFALGCLFVLLVIVLPLWAVLWGMS